MKVTVETGSQRNCASRPHDRSLAVFVTALNGSQSQIAGEPPPLLAAALRVNTVYLTTFP